jgi:hypothetical protein
MHCKRYGDWAPTEWDGAGAFLDDRDEWTVGPVIRTRDSGPLELSNFAAVLADVTRDAEQANEPDTVEVHYFGHWACGHFELILAAPGSAAAAALEEWAGALENYPVADEEAYSRAELEATAEAWENWAASDFRRHLPGEFDLSEVTEDDLWELWSRHADAAGVYWYEEGGGMYADVRRVARHVTAEEVAALPGAVREFDGEVTP